MSTTVLENQQVAAQVAPSAEESKRAATFAQEERQRTEALATSAAQARVQENGTGTTTYSIGMWDNGEGFAELGFSSSSSSGNYVVSQYDWVGVFTNTGQALSNPSSHFLGSYGGWKWASGGQPLVTDVALQPGMVAAYVVKNAAGAYVTVAVTTPWPLS